MRLLNAGTGVVLVPGANHAETWSAEWRALLPATIGAAVDRSTDAGGTLSSLDYAHPIFELFNAPRSGDFSTAKFYRYRTLTPVTGATVPARFDDGSPALVERAVGSGKLLIWASSLDPYWTNLPLQPVFLPFVHQLGKHAGRYADPRPWFTAGDVLDLSRHGELTAPFTAGRADSSSEIRLEAPSGARERLTATGQNHLATLREQGFYELRGRDTPAGSGRPIAVNVDPAESDLSHIDPQEIVAAVTSADNGQHQPGGDAIAATPQDQENRQKVWWYLLRGALLLMAVETAMSNRLSRVSSS